MSALTQGWLPLRHTDSSQAEFRLAPFIYGTAWKGDATAKLVQQALEVGFVALDTAAQPKHYREDLAGEGILGVLAKGSLRRSDIFVQTKFTPVSGQDLESVPYSVEDPIDQQIRSSIAASITNLCGKQNSAGPDRYLDCVMLHSPLDTLMETLIAWRTLEEFVPHKVRYLGISNINRNNLELLYDLMDVKPAVIQNRFCSQMDSFDSSIRDFCTENGVVYQAYGVLSKESNLTESHPVRMLAQEVGIQREAAAYALVASLKNVVVLNGTTDSSRMQSDLAEFQLCQNWISSTANQESWETISSQFIEALDSKQ